MRYLPEILYFVVWGAFAAAVKVLLVIDTIATPPYYVLTKVGMYLMHRTDLTL